RTASAGSLFVPAEASNSAPKKISSRPVTSCSFTLGSWLNARCHSRSLSCGGRNNGGGGEIPRTGASETSRASTPARWSTGRGEGGGDGHPDAGSVEGDPPVTKCVHQRDQVSGQGRGVVPAFGYAGQADTPLVDRDDGEVPGQRRHQHAPGVPGLRPAMHQQQRRAAAPSDRVQAHLAGVDVPAGGRGGGNLPEGWGPRRRAGALPGGRARAPCRAPVPEHCG